MKTPIISDIFLFNEKDDTSDLLHPKVETGAVRLYRKAKENQRDLGAYLVRQSFILSSIDWNIGSAIRFGLSLVPPHPVKEEDKNPDGTTRDSFGVLGRSVYPLFSMINTALSNSHLSMNYSIKLIASVFETRNWNHSINWINSEKGFKELKKAAGNEISDLVSNSWRWAEELKSYRDLMEHYNPLQSQSMVTFTSTDGNKGDGFKFQLCTNPEEKQTRGEGQKWGKEAMSYCIKTFERVMTFNIELLPLLSNKYGP